VKKIIFVALIFIGNRAFSQSDNSWESFQKRVTTKDIVETLTNAGGYVMKMHIKHTSGEPESIQHKREAKILSRIDAIHGRTFAVLDSLFIHSDTLIKLYAFKGICSSYPDSLREDHLKILSYGGNVKIYQQGTNQFPSMKVSEVAAINYRRVEKYKKQDAIEIKIKERIKSFILEYSRYPKSYISISYNNFLCDNYGEIENSKIYSIMHIYKIKTNKGDLIEHKARFTLDNSNNIIDINEYESLVIEEQEQLPQLDWWLNIFGRKLNNRDKKTLGI
jgi:hypothetical protein